MTQSKPVQEAVSQFGAAAKAKLSNPAATGHPEDQLRGPLEALIEDLAECAGHIKGNVVLVGETSLADLKTRPDYSVTIGLGKAKAPLPRTELSACLNILTTACEEDQWPRELHWVL